MQTFSERSHCFMLPAWSQDINSPWLGCMTTSLTSSRTKIREQGIYWARSRRHLEPHYHNRGAFSCSYSLKEYNMASVAQNPRHNFIVWNSPEVPNLNSAVFAAGNKPLSFEVDCFFVTDNQEIFGPCNLCKMRASLLKIEQLSQSSTTFHLLIPYNFSACYS